MCYICNCFAWTLDFIQRVITFALACLMAFAVCCGMSIAIIAGIAYGYNYSLAEFLTFTRSDVTVYMRRGQFFDNPDIILPRSGRRSGESDDIFPINATGDYQDNSLESNAKPLSNTWVKAEDTRKYAEKLTKYSTQDPTFDEDMTEKLNYFKLTTPPTRRISMIHIPGLSTSIWKSGSSEIVMRNFRPIEQLPVFDNANIKDYASLDNSEKVNSKKSADKQIEDIESMTPDNKIRLVESTDETNSFMPMGTTYKAPNVLDYPTEEIDEDNVVYKPV